MGRVYGYITPTYFFEEMDTFDIDKAISTMRADEIKPCLIERMNRNLKEAERLGAIGRI